MKSKKVFFWAWFKLFTVITIIIVVALVLAWNFIEKFPGEIFWSLTLLPFIYGWIIWSKKIIVPPEYEYIYEWQGKKLEPLTSGYNYVFPYFGFLEGKSKIPMNVQTLSILIGVRDGLPESVVNDYIYGTASNVEPENGDAIRILCQVEFQNIDSSKLFYAKSKPYHYIASLVEFKVGAYMKKPIKNATEGLSDHFLSKDWDSEVLDGIGTLKSLREEVFDFIGVKLIHFIPVDLIFSPEIEDTRKKIDIEKRRGELLKEELGNMDTEAAIAKKRNEISGNQIEKVMKTANVSGAEALNFIMREKTLTAVAQASKTGNITYIDGSGDSNFAGGVGFGWGVNATKSKTDPEKKSSEKTDDGDGNKKHNQKKD
jgi:hypothetical protein